MKCDDTSLGYMRSCIKKKKKHHRNNKQWHSSAYTATAEGQFCLYQVTNNGGLEDLEEDIPLGSTHGVYFDAEVVTEVKEAYLFSKSQGQRFPWQPAHC